MYSVQQRILGMFSNEQFFRKQVNMTEGGIVGMWGRPWRSCSHGSCGQQEYLGLGRGYRWLRHSMEQISIKTPNPKCRFFLKIYQGNWRQVFICLRPPHFLWPHTPPPPVTHCKRVNTTVHYMYLFTQGWGGERESLLGSRLEGQYFPKQVENTNMIDCISSL